jgi:hypothetical protein
MGLGRVIEKKTRTYQCTSSQTRQSSDARIQIGKIKTAIRIDADDQWFTLTKVVFPVPPSPTAHSQEGYWAKDGEETRVGEERSHRGSGGHYRLENLVE